MPAVMIERTFIGDTTPERAPARPFVRLRGDQSPTLLLLLSLNLLLIVFFVVLNFNATTDVQRSRNVLASVQTTFSDVVAPSNNLEAASVAKSAAQDALRTSVSSAFASVLEGQDVIVRNAADRFSVIAPAAVLFEPGTNALRPVLPVLNRISAILKAPAEGFRYEMIVTLGVDEASEALAVSQAGILAEDLLRRDFAATDFAVGTAPAETHDVTFTFLVLSEDSAAAGAP
ncbi:MAG: hypothetical protein JNK21_02940 [Rhodospirillaceae bacterium]|nr:hypothetical protein [Rhodospirillaceae bacterium]